MSNQNPANRPADTTDEHPRSAYPSGWLVLVKNESVGYILDALLDLRPRSECTKSELANAAGVSRQSLYTHLELLLALDVLQPVEDTSPQRYRANHDSEVLQRLHEVNGAVNRTLNDGDGNSKR